jgi:glutamate dehydrogenase (NAD(P)+)
MNTAREFHGELASLKRDFEAMRPELALTVADPELGLEGYVVVWNTKIAAGGPLHGAGKGGTRCDADLDLPQVARLACTMALKNAAAGLPLGGAKSGVKMDKNDPDYERKWRRFVELTAPVLHERGGCFGGYGYDRGCHIPQNAIWAVDHLTSKKLGSERSFTGKPVAMGGTDYDNEGIAGLGVAVAARTLLETQGKSAQGARFAVQGMGAMGAAIYRYFSDYGGELAAISDPLLAGTWLLERAPTEALRQALIQRDVATAQRLLPQVGRRISAAVADVLYQDVDVLFPAATEDVITTTNVNKIKARYISEGANNPTDDDAHQILFANQQLVIPDIIANAGGVIAAFVEMTTPTTPEIIAERGKVAKAKELTIAKIANNTRRLMDTVARLNVQPDQVADWMALRDMKYGFC